jgi:hypothetical protein
MKKLSFILLSIVLVSNVLAKEVFLKSGEYKWISDKDFSFQKATAKERSSRKLASQGEITDDLFSKEYKQFRDSFLAIKTPEELDRLLIDINLKYDSYPDDLKLVVALLVPMRATRSFTYKVYPLAAKEKITHSMLVTQVLNFASFVKVNLPTDQWNAGFRYTTEPFTAKDDSEKIRNMDELQNFAGEKIYPELLLAASRISQIKISDKMVWDNKLFYGIGAFSDNFKRYRTFGEAERFALLSSLHLRMAQVARFQAYNVTELVSYVKEVSSLYGYDSVLMSNVDGVTALKIKNVLASPRYINLFVLRPNGAANMATAYKHMKEATRLGLISWTEARSRTADENDMFNSDLVTGSVGRIDKNAEVMERVLAGQTELHSDITGELVVVNFSHFYLNPAKDLKTFAPIGFEQGQKQLSKSIASKNYSYRNYFYGRAIKWNVDAYKNIFPEITKGESVSTYVRILNQSTGADLMASLVNPFIIY